MDFIATMSKKTNNYGIDSVEAAEKLLNTKLSSIVEASHIIGTAWFLSEPCKSVQYHSVAAKAVEAFDRVLRNKLDGFLEADILSVKEKSLGDRASSIKIVGKETEPLCVIEFATKECPVPKKQANSKGMGLKITDYLLSEDVTIGDLLDRAGCKEQAIAKLFVDGCMKNIHDSEYAMYQSLQDGEDISVHSSVIAKQADCLNQGLSQIKDLCKRTVSKEKTAGREDI